MPKIKPLLKRPRRHPIVRQLETLRQDAGLTQTELANAMGIHRETLRRRYVLAPESFTVAELHRAADELKVKLEVRFDDI